MPMIIQWTALVNTLLHQIHNRFGLEPAFVESSTADLLDYDVQQRPQSVPSLGRASTSTRTTLGRHDSLNPAPVITTLSLSLCGASHRRTGTIEENTLVSALDWARHGKTLGP